MTRLQGKQSVVRFMALVRNHSLLQNVQNGSGAHPALCEYQGLLLSMFQNKCSYTSILLHGVDRDNSVFPILHGLHWRMNNLCGPFWNYHTCSLIPKQPIFFYLRWNSYISLWHYFALKNITREPLQQPLNMLMPGVDKFSKNLAGTSEF
jgi:hypothetical protein